MTMNARPSNISETECEFRIIGFEGDYAMEGSTAVLHNRLLL